MFSRGTTNLPRPIPWPWRYDYSRMNFAQSIRALSIGSFFLMLPFVHIFNIISLLVCKKDRLKNKFLLAASSFVGVIYMHYAFSRADIQHLGHGIAPLLIALFALPTAFGFNRKKIRCTLALALLLFMTLNTAGKYHPFYHKASSESAAYIKYDINGDNLWLPRGLANQIEIVKRINSQIIPPQEGFLIAPWQPCMYPILQRESPLWNIYFLLPETEQRQKEMIEELKQKNTNWVLLHNMPMDGREELRFSNTHSLLWKYFTENYEPIKIYGLSSHYIFAHRKPQK